jgi:hypothetical protein
VTDDRLPPARRVIGRRGVLVTLAAGALVAGCRDRAPAELPAPTATAADPRLAAALAREDDLVAAYDAAVAAAPRIADALRQLRDDHARHRAALLAAGATRAARSSTPPPTGTSSPPAKRAAAVLDGLLSAERGAAAAHASACVTAPRRLAPLLGSLAACEHAHGEVLTALRAGHR